MFKQNSLLSTSTLSADDGERKGEIFSEICAKKELDYKVGVSGKTLADLFANEKAMGPLLGLSKSTKGVEDMGRKSESWGGGKEMTRLGRNCLGQAKLS